MRPFNLILSLLCLLALVACGTEEELTPPTFSNVMVNGAAVTSIPFKDPNVTITGSIDDFSATIVANNTVTGETPVIVKNDGTWEFSFVLAAEGSYNITFTASDARGNINQMILTVTYDQTAPLISTLTQSLVGDPSVPQLIITFSEALAPLPSTAPFAVSGSTVTSVTLEPLTKKIVTLSLSDALLPGSHTLTCSGVTDLAGNDLAVAYIFDIPAE